MLFRIERTGPTDGRAVRPVQIHRFRCLHSSHSMLEPTGFSVSPESQVNLKFLPAVLISPGASKTSAGPFLRSHLVLLVDAHPRRPQVGRISARHAHTRHAPSGSAAGAAHSDSLVTPAQILAPSLSPTASHPRDGTGNAFTASASAAPVLANPPQTPTPSHAGVGLTLPSLGSSFAFSAFKFKFGASASGMSVSRPISRVHRRVCILITGCYDSTLPSLLSVH